MKVENNVVIPVSDVDERFLMRQVGELIVSMLAVTSADTKRVGVSSERRPDSGKTGRMLVTLENITKDEADILEVSGQARPNPKPAEGEELWEYEHRLPGYYTARAEFHILWNEGNFLVNRATGATNQELEEWADEQRSLHAAGKLSPEKVAQLEAMPNWHW